MKSKNLSLLLAFVFVFVFLFTACTAAVETGAEKEKQKNVLGILKEAKEDMASVHTVLTDKDLDMANENTSDDNEEIDMEEIEAVLVKIGDYKTDLQKRITAIEQRDAMEDPVLLNFNKSELHCIRLLNEVLDEYEQLANYVKPLYNIINGMSALGASNNNDLEASYNNFSETIKLMLDELNATTPPSYLQSFHKELTEAVEDIQDSVDYLLSAVLINDPLRLNAGTYRFYGILMRDMTKVTENVQKDLDRRMAKINEDAAAIKKLDEGLTAWIDKNIDRLDIEEGGAAK